MTASHIVLASNDELVKAFGRKVALGQAVGDVVVLIRTVAVLIIFLVVRIVVVVVRSFLVASDHGECKSEQHDQGEQEGKQTKLVGFHGKPPI